MEQIRWHYTAEIFFYFSCSFIERWIFSHPPPAAKDKEATTSFMTLICLPLRVRWGSVVSANRSGRLTHIGAVSLRQTVKVNTLQNHCWKPETYTFLALKIFYKVFALQRHVTTTALDSRLHFCIVFIHQSLFSNDSRAIHKFSSLPVWPLPLAIRTDPRFWVVRNWKKNLRMKRKALKKKPSTFTYPKTDES